MTKLSYKKEAEIEFEVPDYYTQIFSDGVKTYNKTISANEWGVYRTYCYKSKDIAEIVTTNDVFYSDDGKKRFHESAKPITREQFRRALRRITKHILENT